MPVILALSIALVVCVPVYWSVSRAAAVVEEARRRMRDAVGREDGLGTYELAYLADGPARVVDTGLAALVGTGRLRVSRDGTLHRVTDADPPADDVERALLDAVGERGARTAADARFKVVRGPEVEAVRHRLVAMGLVVPDEAVVSFRALLARLRRRSTTALVAAVIMAFFAMASMTGTYAAVTGVLAVAALALGVIGVKGRRRLRRAESELADHRTDAGSTRLARMYRGPADLAYSGVALYGLGQMDDRQSAEALIGGDTSFGGGDFGSGGDGGGSGCGGGGCGGGCGGCGG
ncbi:TIGR04222 domain-containing membrane protein [Nonomuraea sp. C10]|uniref:TIGR04222 domain-containing membrane protein n=1 Tax=Nonomuraea sp. C10 TaxID=2600577 RepID=UPI00164FED38|nr:TIGR04222 domain-containing membrane protein [Nonomuraea sp. C10]